MANAAIPSPRPAVRAPFRVLAGLLLLCFIAVAIGMAYMTWKGGVQALRAQDVLMLPGGLWFGRLVFHAAVSAKVPREIHWPFATAGVAQAYWLIVLCVSVASS